VVRGWLGVALQPLSAELAQTLGVAGTAGALVSSTVPGSPAAAAGLQQNDVIVAFDKTPVQDYRHFQRLVVETPVGQQVTLEVLRKKERIRVDVKIAATPDDHRSMPESSPTRP